MTEPQTKIMAIRQLEPYFKIAEDEAHKSPCIRRQYGAVISAIDEAVIQYDASHNVRVSRCCEGKECVRDRVNTRHGGSVEIGGEIHAETSVLIASKHAGEGVFVLVGFEKGHQLYGQTVYPCHACAMAIKFAGYSYIYIRQRDKTIVPVSVAEIIRYRISEWEPVD